MEHAELLWRQYHQNVELYKFYMEQTVKLNVFYYAVTGAVFSFFFANTSLPNIKYSLLLPLLMSVGFAIFFIYGAILMRFLRQVTFEIRDELNLNVAPDLGVLSVLLYIFTVIFITVAITCSIVLWKY